MFYFFYDDDNFIRSVPFCCRNTRPPLSFKILSYAFLLGLLQWSDFFYSSFLLSLNYWFYNFDVKLLIYPLILINIVLQINFYLYMVNSWKWIINFQDYTVSVAIDNVAQVYRFKLPKCCAELGPCSGFCIGTDFPTRKTNVV